MNTPPPPEAPLDELLHHWRERRRQGETLSAEDLCRDAPDLLEGVKARLQRLGMESDRSPPQSTIQEGSLGTQPHLEEEPPLTDLEGYTIERELGRGGMGIVYLARQLGFNRLVAVKVLRHPRVGRRDDVNRFHREIESLASLQHPNIVRVYEVRSWIQSGLCRRSGEDTGARKTPAQLPKPDVDFEAVCFSCLSSQPGRR